MKAAEASCAQTCQKQHSPANKDAKYPELPNTPCFPGCQFPYEYVFVDITYWQHMIYLTQRFRGAVISGRLSWWNWWEKKREEQSSHLLEGICSIKTHWRVLGVTQINRRAENPSLKWLQLLRAFKSLLHDGLNVWIQRCFLVYLFWLNRFIWMNSLFCEADIGHDSDTCSDWSGLNLTCLFMGFYPHSVIKKINIAIHCRIFLPCFNTQLHHEKEEINCLVRWRCFPCSVPLMEACEANRMWLEEMVSCD